VKDWTEQSRYEIGKTEKEATDLYDAIGQEIFQLMNRGPGRLPPSRVTLEENKGDG
jgi:hypothetical protein